MSTRAVQTSSQHSLAATRSRVGSAVVAVGLVAAQSAVLLPWAYQTSESLTSVYLIGLQTEAGSVYMLLVLALALLVALRGLGAQTVEIRGLPTGLKLGLELTGFLVFASLLIFEHFSQGIPLIGLALVGLAVTKPQQRAAASGQEINAAGPGTSRAEEQRGQISVSGIVIQESDESLASQEVASGAVRSEKPGAREAVVDKRTISPHGLTDRRLSVLIAAAAALAALAYVAELGQDPRSSYESLTLGIGWWIAPIAAGVVMVGIVIRGPAITDVAGGRGDAAAGRLSSRVIAALRRSSGIRLGAIALALEVEALAAPVAVSAARVSDADNWTLWPMTSALLAVAAIVFSVRAMRSKTKSGPIIGVVVLVLAIVMVLLVAGAGASHIPTYE